MPFFSQNFLLYLEFLTETKKVPKVMLFGYVSNCDISFKTSN